MKRRLIATAAVTTALLLAPVAASASTGADFGTNHVSQHARDHGGFVGDHNPGVLHQGFSNWDPGDHHLAG